MTPFQKRTPRAIALAEMLVCIAVVGLLSSLTTVCYTEMIRLRAGQQRYDARRLAAEYFLRRFANDIRPGRAFLKRYGEYSAGTHTLIIARDSGVVAYHISDSGVTRLDTTSGKKREEMILPPQKLDAWFDLEGREPASAPSAVLTIAWKEPAKIGISRPVLSLRVTLRNRPPNAGRLDNAERRRQ